MAIRLDQIVLRHLRMPLVHFFETSFGRTHHRDIILIEVRSDGVSGWGEVTAGENPFSTLTSHRLLTCRLAQLIFEVTRWLAAAWKQPYGTCRRD